VLVHRVTDAAQVVGGCNDAYAILRGTGTVTAWGEGAQGQIGDGHRATRLYPVPAAGLAGITSIAPGWKTTYAVRDDGTVYAWGFDLTQQVGLGDPSPSYVPLPTVVPGFGRPIAFVSASTTGYTEENYAAALGRDGSIWTWGGLFGPDSPAQITRTPPFRPASAVWVYPPGGNAFGYNGVVYFAD
jgi:alpha-tubulin suppressor-like RCC1 family protein